jgi:hypothetical protein
VILSSILLAKALPGRRSDTADCSCIIAAIVS